MMWWRRFPFLLAGGGLTRGEWTTYEDSISVVSMVELVNNSVVVLLLDSGRALGELKA
jgi:hypothetical protein